MWSVCFQPLFCPACLWSQGALGWPCLMAGLSYCCCWLSGHHGSLYYLCRSLSSLSLCGASPRHTGHRAHCQWEAVSPAVTDSHSHSNSFTNHWFHTATMAGSCAGKIPLDLHTYTHILQTSLRSTQGIKRCFSEFDFTMTLNPHNVCHLIYLHEHLIICWCTVGISSL